MDIFIYSTFVHDSCTNNNLIPVQCTHVPSTRSCCCTLYEAIDKTFRCDHKPSARRAAVHPAERQGGGSPCECDKKAYASHPSSFSPNSKCNKLLIQPVDQPTSSLHTHSHYTLTQLHSRLVTQAFSYQYR